MELELIIAIIAGLGGMLGWGFADFFAKKTIDKIGDVPTLFWAQLIGVIPLLILYIANPVRIALSSADLSMLILLGIWEGLSYLLLYRAFGKGKVSLISPIYTSYAVIVVLLSAVFFKEVILFNRQFALITVFIGVFLIAGDPRDIFHSLKAKTSSTSKVQGLPETFASLLLYAVWLIVFDQFLGQRYWVPPLLGMRMATTTAIFLYSRTRKIRLVVTVPSLWKYLIAIGLFDVAAFSFVSYGLTASSFTSIVAMISAAFSLPTIVLARVFLKEKITVIQTIGSLVIVAGVVLLTM